METNKNYADMARAGLKTYLRQIEEKNADKKEYFLEDAVRRISQKGYYEYQDCGTYYLEKLNGDKIRVENLLNILDSRVLIKWALRGGFEVVAAGSVITEMPDMYFTRFTLRLPKNRRHY